MRLNSYSAAYREAYDVAPGTKAETIHSTAWELAQRPVLTDRIKALEAAKERESLRDRAKLTDWLRESMLQSLALLSEKDKAPIYALLAKHAGMLVDRVETKQQVSISDAEQRLSDLLRQLGADAVQSDKLTH